MKKRPYALWMYWEDAVKLGTHHSKTLKFNTIEEAVDYAKTLQDEIDWAVFDEQHEIVANKGDKD